MDYRELLLFLSVLPSIILGSIIYKKDSIEKESKKLLVKLFLCGIASTFVTLILTLASDIILPQLTETKSNNYISLALFVFIKIAFIEEFSKWIFLRKVTWKNKEFNYIYDAIVYSVFISLGFATLENILYVFDGGLSVAITRALLSVPGHTFFAVFMGYYYGLSKQAEINKNKSLLKKNMILSLLVPCTLHFSFDYLLMVGDLLLLLVYLAFVIFLYIYAIKKINQLSKITLSLTDKTITTNINNSQKVICINCKNEVYGLFCSNCGRKRQ